MTLFSPGRLMAASLAAFALCSSSLLALSLNSGEKDWEIVVPEGSADSVQLAARELRDYVRRALNVDMPIVSAKSAPSRKAFYLGDTPVAKSAGIEAERFSPDGFRILSVEDGLVISGIDYKGPPMIGHDNPYRLHESYNAELKISAFGNTGTLQGVYEFLRRYVGVRWYMPGELGEIVPSRTSIDLKEVDLALAPKFEHRYAYFCFFGAHSRDALWYKRAGFGTPFPVEITHTLGRLFIKYKDTNPEYFALVNGQRDFTTLSTIIGPGNYNLAHPGFIEQAVKDAKAYFDANPNAKIFALGPNDGMKKISEDAESQAQIDHSAPYAGQFSNYVWGFINKVAIEVAKTHPDRMIGCIAYEKYTLPPTNIDKLSPNVAVVLCKFRRNLGEPGYEETLYNSVARWKEMASAVYTWEYYCDILLNPGWRGYPILYSEYVQKDLQRLNGVVRGEFLEAESWTSDQYRHPEQIKINYPGIQHPLLYITGRLMWNPDENVAAVLDEYYTLFYGPAAEPMKAFWQEVERAWTQAKRHQGPAEVYDPATLSRLVGYLEEAAGQTATNSPEKQRIELIRSEFLPVSEQASRLAAVQKPKVSMPTTEGGAADAIDPNLWVKTEVASLINRNFKVAAPATHVRVKATPDDLRFLVISFEPSMDRILAKVQPGTEDRVWEDDSVEIFVRPEGTKPIAHFIVNSNGALYDAINHTGNWSSDERSWTSNAEVVTSKEESRWLTEIRIPWSAFGLKSPPSQLQGNIFRNRFASGVLEQQSWAPMLTGNYLDENAFGTWEVKKP